MFDDSLPWAVQKRLNRSRYRLGYGLGWSQGNVLKGSNFRGKDMPGHAWRHSAVRCAKWLNRSTCGLGCELGWVEKSMCYLGGMLAPNGKYDWTASVRRCGLMAKYFDYLFSFDTLYKVLSHCVIVSESCLSQSSAIFGSIAFLNCSSRPILVKATFTGNWRYFLPFHSENVCRKWPHDVKKTPLSLYRQTVT